MLDGEEDPGSKKPEEDEAEEHSGCDAADRNHERLVRGHPLVLALEFGEGGELPSREEILVAVGVRVAGLGESGGAVRGCDLYRAVVCAV